MGPEGEHRPELDDEFERTPADLGVEHRLSREIVCSLPRGISCRICPGEKDCPYIIDRPHGRLIVHKRPPHSAVVHSHIFKLTGSANRGKGSHPWLQRILAVGGWLVLGVLVLWTWVLHSPGWLLASAPLALLLATFGFVVVGVPVVRQRWADRGGRRRQRDAPDG